MLCKALRLSLSSSLLALLALSDPELEGFFCFFFFTTSSSFSLSLLEEEEGGGEGALAFFTFGLTSGSGESDAEAEPDPDSDPDLLDSLSLGDGLGVGVFFLLFFFFLSFFLSFFSLRRFLGSGLSLADLGEADLFFSFFFFFFLTGEGEPDSEPLTPIGRGSRDDDEAAFALFLSLLLALLGGVRDLPRLLSLLLTGEYDLLLRRGEGVLLRGGIRLTGERRLGGLLLLGEPDLFLLRGLRLELFLTLFLGLGLFLDLLGLALALFFGADLSGLADFSFPGSGEGLGFLGLSTSGLGEGVFCFLTGSSAGASGEEW